MPAIAANGIRMYYERHGAGEPLLLIAGLASDHTFFRTFVPRLAERWHVISFDNRGAGRSDKPDIPYTIDMMADDTAALLDTLGSDPAHVLGTSLGGRIAVALALRRPELVRSLVLVSTCVRPPPVTWSRRLNHLVLLLFKIPGLRGSQPYYAAVRQRDASRRFDATGRLHEIRVPTLILHGRRDRLAPLALAKELHAGIAGSTLRTFAGGHLFFLMRQRAFLDAACTFLDRT